MWSLNQSNAKKQNQDHRNPKAIVSNILWTRTPVKNQWASEKPESQRNIITERKEFFWSYWCVFNKQYSWKYIEFSESRFLNFQQCPENLSALPIRVLVFGNCDASSGQVEKMLSESNSCRFVLWWMPVGDWKNEKKLTWIIRKKEDFCQCSRRILTRVKYRLRGTKYSMC